MYRKLILAFAFLSASAHATLSLELTQGINSALPIAIVKSSLSDVIASDLKNSGRFRTIDGNETPHSVNEVNSLYWRGLGADNLLITNVTSSGSTQNVHVILLDPVSRNNVLLDKTFQANNMDNRRIAHRISDLVYERLTGEKGVFSTKIAYILVKELGGGQRRHQLIVADVDGYNPHGLLTSSQPIMSPAWAPNGREIAYVSFEQKRAQIYVVNVVNGQRRLITSFPGINGAPEWSPDGGRLAIVLSKSGKPKIYIVDLAARSLKQVTFGLSIDTEPTWSPDGRSLYFTSDQGGAPQIYKLNLANNSQERVTFDGPFNATASVSHDGTQMAILHRTGTGYNIAIQDLRSGSVRDLTFAGHTQSPTLAPNGRMVLYATYEGTRGVLNLVSTDGKVKVRLPSQEGHVQEPSWSPFLS